MEVLAPHKPFKLLNSTGINILQLMGLPHIYFITSLIYKLNLPELLAQVHLY